MYTASRAAPVDFQLARKEGSMCCLELCQGYLSSKTVSRLQYIPGLCCFQIFLVHNIIVCTMGYIFRKHTDAIVLVLLCVVFFGKFASQSMQYPRFLR